MFPDMFEIFKEEEKRNEEEQAKPSTPESCSAPVDKMRALRKGIANRTKEDIRNAGGKHGGDADGSIDIIT